MLAELRVTQLGVIEDVTVVLGPGMTALTGETGAGKTLIVDAISLLLGGRADPALVRPGADEAVVEGRFVGSEGVAELVLTRVIPATGRARAYIDGRMASAQQLGELGEQLVDLHGQHAHQSLLRPAAQRAALDAGAGITTDELMEARRKLRALAKAQADIGGDARSRTRELDLLRYQVGELDAAGIDSPSEDDDLRGEEEWLSDASTLRQAAAMVAEGLAGDEGIIDRLGSLVSQLSGRPPLRSLHDRLLAGQAELSDVAGGARAAVETFEDDPGRLTEVGARRRLLTDLRRKYGDTLAEVIAFGNQARARIAELEDHDSRAASLDRDRSEAEAELRAAEERLGTARRASAASSGSGSRRIGGRASGSPSASLISMSSKSRSSSATSWTWS